MKSVNRKDRKVLFKGRKENLISTLRALRHLCVLCG
jgi:hypothetical protein